MGDYIVESADLADPAFSSDQQIIGHFDVGPAGVGPMTGLTTGEFYPRVPTKDAPSAESPPD